MFSSWWWGRSKGAIVWKLGLGYVYDIAVPVVLRVVAVGSSTTEVLRVMVFLRSTYTMASASSRNIFWFGI